MNAVLLIAPLFVEYAAISVIAFAPALICRTRQTSTRGFSSSTIKKLTAGNDFDAFEEEEGEEEPELLDRFIGKNLGINIGSELPPISPEEMEEIRVQTQATLDKAIDSRLAEIAALREQMKEDITKSEERMKIAGNLNAQIEKQNLMEKIDRLSDDFLRKNAEFVEETQRVAAADQSIASLGLGVDWGSWGTLAGMEVVVGSGVIGDHPSKLLGSVDSHLRKVDSSLEVEDLDVPQTSKLSQNRVLVVSDGQKDKGSKRVVDILRQLLENRFNSDIIVDSYSPTSNIPIGGNNAQTALIFASSLNDRSSLENLLGRVLKRTAPVSGGAAGNPPSHVVIVSSLGTERTNRMPYSMQNMFGGKLDKQREIDEAVVSISRTRIAGKQNPLDYTIVKFGEVTLSDNEDREESIKIQPGDSLDGEIGPNAAANVLLQAMAYQPYARNSTLCAIGHLSMDTEINHATWNDKFLCLDGPELLRIEAGPRADNSDEKILNAKFEQLTEYVKEWSMTFESNRKGTGLTTPVLIRNSRKPPSELDGVIARNGVRILFQTTNTGERYKSAIEERKEEKERNSAVPRINTSSAPVSSLTNNAKKEGGVEILVEKTIEGTLRVRACRCNMDQKTIVKEMSEEVIVRSLKKAVHAWIGVRSLT